MEKYQIKNRQTNEIFEIREDKSTLFLYNTLPGRLILKLITIKFISVLAGLYMSSRLSKLKINNFIKTNNIDMSDYKETNYPSFNAFFTRLIKENARPIDNSPNAFISPCDAKLMVYKINKDNEFKIKNSYYSIKDLINNDISEEYINGYALIFRLCVDDYHRYSYLDDGYKEINHYIKGRFHAVRPIALKHHNIYKQNAREWTILHTKNFGEVIQIEVGAMMVGKIVNYHQEYNFKKGEEKGFFKFGGSTIVLLIKNNIINIDKDILNNSNQDIETTIKLGEKIGQKIN